MAHSENEAPAWAGLGVRGFAFLLGSATLAEGKCTAQTLCRGKTTEGGGFRLRRPALLRRTKPGHGPGRL